MQGVGTIKRAICRNVETFGARFGSFGFALLLLGKGRAHARFACVGKAEFFREALRPDQAGFLVTGNPAAGAAAPQEKGFDFAFRVVGQRVIGFALEVQLKLEGIEIADKVADRLRGVGFGGERRELVGGQMDIVRHGIKPPYALRMGSVSMALNCAGVILRMWSIHSSA